MLTTMAAGATLAATATQLANATDYVQQLQGLLRATEAALDTANKLNATGGRWLKLFKPILTARAHYKEALEVYALAMETINPCIETMNKQDALDFLALATLYVPSAPMSSTGKLTEIQVSRFQEGHIRK